MYIIKAFLDNHDVYFVKLEKQICWGSDWDVRTCSRTINIATKYKTLEEANKICHSLDKNFKVYPVCPKCHQDYYGYPAISRKDNKTKICDKCGLTEALTDFFEYEKKTTN